MIEAIQLNIPALLTMFSQPLCGDKKPIALPMDFYARSSDHTLESLHLCEINGWIINSKQAATDIHTLALTADGEEYLLQLQKQALLAIKPGQASISKTDPDEIPEAWNELKGQVKLILSYICQLEYRLELTLGVFAKRPLALKYNQHRVQKLILRDSKLYLLTFDSLDSAFANPQTIREVKGEEISVSKLIHFEEGRPIEPEDFEVVDIAIKDFHQYKALSNFECFAYGLEAV